MIASGVAVEKLTSAEAVASGLAALLAVIVADEALFEETNRPSLLIVPPFADQTTAALAVPLTLAVNWTVSPGVMCAFVGEMLTDTAGVDFTG